MSLPAGMDPSTIPLMANPSGAPADFDNGPSLLNAQLGTGIALIVVGGICVVLRILTNLKISRKLCLDDCKSALLMYLPGAITDKQRQDLCLFAYAGGVGYWALNLCCKYDHFPKPLTILIVSQYHRRVPPDTPGMFASLS